MKKLQGYSDVGLAFFLENYKWILTPVIVVGLVALGLYFSGVFGGESISAEGSESKTKMVAGSDSTPRLNVPAPARAPAPVALIAKPTPNPKPAPTINQDPAAVDKVLEYKVVESDDLDAEIGDALPETLVPLRQVRIPINVVGALDLGSLEFELQYEPGTLEFLEAGNGSLGPDSLVQAHLRAPGRLWVGIVNPRGINGEGDVAFVTFQRLEEGLEDSPLILEGVVSHQASTLLISMPQASHGIYDLDDSSYVSPSLTFPPQQ